MPPLAVPSFQVVARSTHTASTEKAWPVMKPGDHVPKELLKAWAEGRAPEPLKRVIAGHVEKCAACRRALTSSLAPVRKVKDALEGRQLGPYLIEKRLGEGGMGAVYRAVDSRSKRPVAIKVLLSHLSEDDSNERRFRHEVDVLAKVKHPNVVAHLDSGVMPNGRGQYLVMELLDGEPLAERLKREPIPRDEVLGALVQACAGLEAVHRAGVLHRDLKPGNLFLCRDGTLKLIDFGLARSAEGTKLTAAGLLMGTVGFVAPEQLDGDPATVKSDLYSLGISAWRLLTRTDPFKGKNLQERIRLQLSLDSPKLRSELPDASQELEAVLAAVLAKDPRRRPASAAELGTRFAALLERPTVKHRPLTLGDEGNQPTIKVGALTGPTEPVRGPFDDESDRKTVLAPSLDLGRKKR